MKQGSSNRRSRSRGGKRIGGGGGGGKNSNFESNGPEVKIRGTAQQVQEKYLALARDAYSAGDRVAAEAFFQYADHYYRILNPEGGNGAGKGRGGHDDNRPHADVPRPGGGQSRGEAEVIDTAQASRAAVTEPKNANVEPADATDASTGPEPEQAAS